MTANERLKCIEIIKKNRCERKIIKTISLCMKLTLSECPFYRPSMTSMNNTSINKVKCDIHIFLSVDVHVSKQ